MILRNISFLFLVTVILTSCFSTKKTVKTNQISVDNQLEFSYQLIEAEKQLMTGNMNNAVELFTKCIQMNPKSGVPYYRLSHIYMLQNDLFSAVTQAEKAAKADEENKWYWLSLAELYRKINKQDKAAIVYKYLISKTPEDIDLQFELADTYTALGDWKNAIKTYDNIESLSGLNESIILAKNRIYLSQNQTDQAIKEIDKLIKAHPKNMGYLGLKADLYSTIKQLEKAKALYDEILIKDPQNARVHLQLANYYFMKNQLDKSLQELIIAFNDPELEVENKLNIMVNTMMMPDETGQLEKQNDTLITILLNVHPQNPTVHQLYAEILMKYNRNDVAAQELQKALELDPGKLEIWERLLALLFEAQNFESLFINSQKSLEYFPNNTRFYFYQGFSASKLNKYDEASVAYKTGLEITSEKDFKLQFLSLLAELNNENRNYEESDRAFAQLIELNPNDISALNNWSYYLSLRGDSLQKAKTMIEKCIAIEPNSCTYIDTYSWVLYKMKDFAKARIVMEKCINQGQNSRVAVIIEHYGDILFQLGEEVKALEQWKIAQQLGKGSDFLESKIEEKKLIE